MKLADLFQNLIFTSHFPGPTTQEQMFPVDFSAPIRGEFCCSKHKPTDIPLEKTLRCPATTEAKEVQYKANLTPLIHCAEVEHVAC